MSISPYTVTTSRSPGRRSLDEEQPCLLAVGRTERARADAQLGERQRPTRARSAGARPEREVHDRRRDHCDEQAGERTSGVLAPSATTANRPAPAAIRRGDASAA